MIERALIAEFLLYLLPLILLIGLTYYSYNTKGLYLKEFYQFLYLVPLFTVILSLKFFFVLEFPARKIFVSSIADSVLFMVLVLFILPVLKDLGFNWRSQLNKTLLITVLPYLSLFFLNNLHSAVDLFSYWTISVFIILVSSWLYEEDKTLKGIFYISTSVFYVDYAVRFLAYYGNLNFYRLVELSSFIGILALGMVMLEALLFIKHRKSIDTPEEVKKIRVPTMRRTILITLVVSLSVLVFVSFAADYYNNSVISSEKSIRSMLYETGAQLTTRSSEFFDRANALLETLASGYSLKSGNPEMIKTKIKEAYLANKDLFSSLTYMDKNGVIVYTYPYENVSGKSIRNQPHVALLLKTHQPVISDPIKTVQGIYAVVIHQPLFKNDRFSGSVAGLIRLSSLNKTLSAYDKKETGFIISEGKIVIASSDRNFMFKKFEEIPQKFFRENIVESNSFTFLNKTFFIHTYFPITALKKIENEIAKRVSFALLFLFSLILSLFYFMLEIIRRGDIDKSMAVEKAILKEKEERKKYQDIYTRLSKIFAFFKNVSFSKPEEEFFADFLDIAISVMPNGEKGTIALNSKDGYLRFVAAKGYDLEKLKKLRIPFKKEENITRKGHIPIIKKIYRSDEKFLSPEGIKVLKEIGNYGIKSTLTAPIYVRNNYIGSIFIDNFQSEDAFKEEDIKVAESISQIASLFAEGKKYVRELRHNLVVSSAVSDIVSAFAKNNPEKNPAQLALPILQKHVSPNLIFFAICINSLSGYTLHCATMENGGSLILKDEILKIESKKLISADLIGKNIFTNIPECRDVNIKSIYAVPVKDAGFWAVFGFNVEEISENIKNVLNKLTKELQYVFANVELLKQLSETHIETLITMVKTIEAKDPYTKNHSEHVTIYSYLLGEKCGLDTSDMKILYYSALLHDIGKIGIPDSILKKQGKLLPEEYALIKKHPEYGAEIIKDIEFLREASSIVLYHHERWDGNGYPRGLKGENIPLLSRIISIADTFDAITSNRSYRRGRSFEEAFLIISKERGKQFDPILANAFLGIEEDVLKKYRDNSDILSLYKKLFR